MLWDYFCCKNGEEVPRITYKQGQEWSKEILPGKKYIHHHKGEAYVIINSKSISITKTFQLF